MKLTDPLMGYKLASGQPVIHLAFGIAIMMLPNTDKDDTLTSALNGLFLSHIISTIILSLNYVIDLLNGGV